MTKFFRILSYIVLFLALLSLWSAGVRRIYLGGDDPGKFGKVIILLAELPSNIKSTLSFSNIDEAIEPGAATELKLPDDFTAVNILNYDLWALTAIWNTGEDAWEVILINLKNDSLSHSWFVREQMLQGEAYLEYDLIEFHKYIHFNRLRPTHSILMENKDVLVKMRASNNLFRLDSNSNVLWNNNDMIYHHSTDLGVDGHIWVCGTTISEFGHNAVFRGPEKSLISFRDDYIVKINEANGDLMYKRSITEILVNNGLVGLLAIRAEFDQDPIHLNDIEPVMEDGPFWKKGDLFLSLRSLHTVMLYRPSSDSILWIKTGSFIGQHDVEILDDHRIGIFNNNGYRDKSIQAGPDSLKSEDILVEYEMFSSQFMVFDLSNDSVSIEKEEAFRNHNIYSKYQGIATPLGKGHLFIEETNSGMLTVLDENGKLLFRKGILVNGSEGMVHLPNWTRIYEGIEP